MGVCVCVREECHAFQQSVVSSGRCHLTPTRLCFSLERFHQKHPPSDLGLVWPDVSGFVGGSFHCMCVEVTPVVGG